MSEPGTPEFQDFKSVLRSPLVVAAVLTLLGGTFATVVTWLNNSGQLQLERLKHDNQLKFDNQKHQQQLELDREKHKSQMQLESRKHDSAAILRMIEGTRNEGVMRQNLLFLLDGKLIDDPNNTMRDHLLKLPARVPLPAQPLTPSPPIDQLVQPTPSPVEVPVCLDSAGVCPSR